ncbi:MAG: glutamate--tRNA ligase [Candidatus Puniceispirillum sp.]|nr:glutamate--tRNA ligase [Candidatus Puniceispirillum sp.]MBL6775126.1 glutamate--tRNA ligase [Candidatus Puniceispirillum sp.]
MNVVTRFAPSPTGYLHIGGARTALFNWLFARHHGGTYLLRIEDTDKARSTNEAIAAIHDGLDWLGLGGDQPALSQSAQSSRHHAVALALIAAGAAYRCYLTEDELTAIRGASKQSGNAVRSPWRDKNPNEAPADAPFVVRMRMPSEGSTTIVDAVQGTVTVQNHVLDDMVILRADGSPTYMLAVVVDDHDMGITHVIRGDDHLNNAFRQYMVYQGMGWDVPVFAHIPLIHGSDGAKLSKRHGALGVDAYRDMGFLPEAMFSYLLKLGWSYGDMDIIGRDDAVSLFDLDRIGKSPARFDSDKLRDVNAHFIRTMDDDKLFKLIAETLAERGNSPSDTAKSRICALLPLLKERAKTHLDIAGSIGYLLVDGAVTIEDDAAALLSDDAKKTLLDLDRALETAPWTADGLKQAVNDYVTENVMKMRDIGLPLRAAVTGRKQTPSIIDIMVALGQAETSQRLRVACK